MGTKISWSDETINPVVGCSKVGDGCRNCYAENMARRLAAMGLKQYKEAVKWVRGRELLPHPTGGWNGKTFFVPSELEKPYKWKKPKTIFVTSMGDLFHESVERQWADEIMKCVIANQQHTFIFLTKRPVRMQGYFQLFKAIYGLEPPVNLALGVSVEDQATANERIPILLQIPAAKRVISYEPAIGPVDFNRFLHCDHAACNDYGPGPCDPSPCQSRPIAGIIVGGESGPKARPINPEWVRLIRDQCQAASVPFMFKQWGEWVQWGGLDCGGVRHLNLDQMNSKYKEGPHCMYRVGKKLAGNMLDGRTHTELAWSVKK